MHSCIFLISHHGRNTRQFTQWQPRQTGYFHSLSSPTRVFSFLPELFLVLDFRARWGFQRVAEAHCFSLTRHMVLRGPCAKSHWVRRVAREARIVVSSAANSVKHMCSDYAHVRNGRISFQRRDGSLGVCLSVSLCALCGSLFIGSSLAHFAMRTGRDRQSNEASPEPCKI